MVCHGRLLCRLLTRMRRCGIPGRHDEGKASIPWLECSTMGYCKWVKVLWVKRKKVFIRVALPRPRTIIELVLPRLWPAWLCGHLWLGMTLRH